MLSKKRKGKRFNRKHLSKKKSKKIKKMRAGALSRDPLSKESFLIRNRLIAYMGDIIHRHYLSLCSTLKKFEYVKAKDELIPDVKSGSHERDMKNLLGNIPIRNSWCSSEKDSPQPMLRRYFNFFLDGSDGRKTPSIVTRSNPLSEWSGIPEYVFKEN